MEMNTPQTSGQGDPDRASVSSPVDGTCSEKTVRGESCRRLAGASGLCGYHLHHQRSVTVVDPLEVVDWLQPHGSSSFESWMLDSQPTRQTRSRTGGGGLRHERCSRYRSADQRRAAAR